MRAVYFCSYLSSKNSKAKAEYMYAAIMVRQVVLEKVRTFLQVKLQELEQYKHTPARIILEANPAAIGPLLYELFDLPHV